MIFPERAIRTTQAVDPEDFNRNLLPFAEAAEGRLGEHNWANAAFDSSTSDRDFFSNNIGFTVRKAIRDVDHTSIASVADARTQNGFEIPKTGTWAEVTDATLDFDTAGGMAFIFTRALYWSTTTDAVTVGVGSVPTDDPGIMIALRIDGNLIPESIMGSAELGNDTVNSFNSPGACVTDQDAHPVATRTLEALTPGRHTIELLVRLCGPQDSTSDAHFLLTRELNVLEIGVG